MAADSLRVVVIIGKALRAGLTPEQAFAFTTKLAELATEPAESVTGSTRITLTQLTNAGIRLHPLQIPGIYP